MKSQLLALSISFFIFSTATAAERPNVLFISVDDLKPTLSCYGDTVAKTPNFSRLAKRATIFTNANCNQAVCGPSRASTYTSLRPDRTRVHDLQTAWLEVSPWLTTLPQHLRDNGYVTAGTGKLLHAGKSEKQLNKASWNIHVETEDLPFHEKYGVPAGKFYHGKTSQKVYHDLIATGETRYQKVNQALVAANARPPFEALDLPDTAYNDGAIRKQAIKFLDDFSDSEKPFFIAVGFNKPHLPFVAPKKYWDLYDPAAIPLATVREKPENSPQYASHNFGELRSYNGIPKKGAITDTDLQRKLVHGYYACVSYIDAQLGRLLDELENQNLTDNTVIVLWSDHGWHLGDHGLWCKHSNFEQAVRSVLMMSGPGITAGERNGSPVELIDVFPTICDLVDVPMVKNRDGLSLLPILTGETKEIREVAVSQYGRPHKNAMGYSLRAHRYRYTAWVKNPDFKTAPVDLRSGQIMAEELYDYKTDPDEKVSLAGNPENESTVIKFRKLFKKHIKNQADRIAR